MLPAIAPSGNSPTPVAPQPLVGPPVLPHIVIGGWGGEGKGNSRGCDGERRGRLRGVDMVSGPLVSLPTLPRIVIGSFAEEDEGTLAAPRPTACGRAGIAAETVAGLRAIFPPTLLAPVPTPLGTPALGPDFLPPRWSPDTLPHRHWQLRRGGGRNPGSASARRLWPRRVCARCPDSTACGDRK